MRSLYDVIRNCICCSVFYSSTIHSFQPSISGIIFDSRQNSLKCNDDIIPKWCNLNNFLISISRKHLKFGLKNNSKDTPHIFLMYYLEWLQLLHCNAHSKRYFCKYHNTRYDISGRFLWRENNPIVNCKPNMMNSNISNNNFDCIDRRSDHNKC